MDLFRGADLESGKHGDAVRRQRVSDEVYVLHAAMISQPDDVDVLMAAHFQKRLGVVFGAQPMVLTTIGLAVAVRVDLQGALPELSVRVVRVVHVRTFTLRLLLHASFRGYATSVCNPSHLLIKGLDGTLDGVNFPFLEEWLAALSTDPCRH